MTKLLIVDGNSLANRAFYALPFLTNSKVEPSGAVYGFANLLSKMIVDYHPDGIVVAFDHARKTFRNDIYKDYKANRKATPPELLSQFPIIKKMLQTMNIKVIEKEGIEADDIIGTIAKNANCEKIILSGDRDLLQLISPDTEVWLTMKGVTEIAKVKEDNLKEIYGVEKPEQVIDLKSLMGDKSDNIPGVKGIGEKTAHNLIEKYGNLQEIYEHIDDITGKTKTMLEGEKTLAYISKDLATIKTDCEIDFNLNESEYDFPFTQKTYEFFDNWNFGSLTKRQDLFENNFSELVDENSQRIKIENLSDINKIKEEIDGQFAYSISNMEFAPCKEKVYFLPTEIDMFSNNIALEDVVQELKDVFENTSIQKLTESAKDDMHFLDKQNIKLNNFYDLTLAGYVLYTGVTNKISKMPTNLYFSKKIQLDKNLKEMGTKDIFYRCELPLVEVLFDMEKEGFKLDKNELDKIDVEFTKELETTVNEIYDLAGEEFNINSPKIVAHILFEKLGLKAYNNKKMSTSVDILNEISWQHPIVDKIIKYRKYQKYKTTYIEVYKKICQTQGDVIHTSFNQTLTNTGRLSSSEPNLQNIPTRSEEGRLLRKIFISKFEDGMLISADYNQIELRLLADMSGEEKYIEIYKNGGDIHALTASQIFNVPVDDVTPHQRRDAKAVNFGIIYGISQFGLSQTLGVPVKIANEYIESYFNKYPKIKQYNEDCVQYAHKNGYVKTKYGRIRHIPEINSSNHTLRMFAERVAKNMPLQGTASDIIKFAMIEVYKKMIESSLKSKLILQIHDELIVDVYPSEMASVEKILKETMENIVKLRVPLIINIGKGKNLYECKD